MFDSEKPLQLRRAIIMLEIALAFVLAITVPLIIDNTDIKTFYGVSAESCLVNQGYGLYVDGELIAVCESEADINKALSKVTDAVAEAYGTTEGTHKLCNEIKVAKGDYSKKMFTDTDNICTLLGCSQNGLSFDVYTVGGDVTDINLSVSTVATVKKEETVEAPVVSVGTDLLEKGDILTVKQEIDGLSINEYSVTYINGVETNSVLVGSTVINAPVAGEQWYGTDNGATLMSAEEKFMLPVSGWVTSWYGGREIWGATESHKGIDFAGAGASYGDPIYAAADGIVSFAGFHGGWGNKIVIDHTKELSTLYAHCSKIVVEDGDVVRKGQLIGYIGNTGMVTGPHLHLEVLLNGNRVNPKGYLDWTVYQWGAVN